MKTKLTAFIAVLAAAAIVAVPSMASGHHHVRDGIPNKWEKHFNLSLNVNQATRDQDNDGVDNMCEFKSGDSPRDADTDNDGVEDQNEADDMQCEANENENEAENEAADDDSPNSGPGNANEDNSGPGSHH